MQSNQFSDLYSYFQEAGPTHEDKLKEFFTYLPLEELRTFLRYLSRMLIEAPSFCSADPLLRSNIAFNLDLIESFFEAVEQEAVKEQAA